MPSRSFKEECEYLERISSTAFLIKKGFVPNMKVPGKFYINDTLEKMMFDELRNWCGSDVGGFLPGVKQIANVAALPGIVGHSIGLPDVHSGYGFAIGNMAAFDMSLPEAVVSPGGVGFDINCGVRLLRTNLDEKDVQPVKERLAQALFDHIPVGVGSKGVIPMGPKDLESALEMGMDWSLREGYAWAEDKEHCEEYGRMLQADSGKVSSKAKKRGLPQLGTLGAGNHYAEIQVVDEIFDDFAAKKMGIDHTGQVCLMIHSGSRGLGHQVATDALVAMERAMKRDTIVVNDRQLACARIMSDEGQNYLKSMAAAANFAWVNRSSMTFLSRQLHNIMGSLGGRVVIPPTAVAHGSSPGLVASSYRPACSNWWNYGNMQVHDCIESFSYVLTGTDKGMTETFGSTCHGAVSIQSSTRTLDYQDVLASLQQKGIAIRVASPKLVMEEVCHIYSIYLQWLLDLSQLCLSAPQSYKDVTNVVNTCHEAGISKKAIKLRPIAVIKG
ncbi:hypothetical protein QZH41_011050 [Actinostola sp. cb2023]|nr:hypothetical protein QZH41_011050 [Actinostola sp. cb2023]